MATDFFAHAVYGVQLDQDDVDRIDKQVAELKKEHDDLTDEEIRDALFSVEDHGRLLHLSLIKKYKAPPGAFPYWTGSEDDRPGRCNTESEVYVLGFSLYSFPQKMPAAGWDCPHWHAWVSAG